MSKLYPCGTPAGTVFHSEKQSSPILTVCLRTVMKSDFQSRVDLELLHFSRLFSKMLRSMLSKDFEKLKRIIPFAAVGIRAFV